MADKTVYIRTQLIGGGVNAVDGIDGNDLLDGDYCFVPIHGHIKYEYTLEASSAASEKAPFVIKPDANAGDKRWHLKTPYVAYADPTVTDQGAATAEGYRSIKDLVDAIGATRQATIICQPTGTGDTTTFTLTTSETITSNITLRIENGAILDGAGTLTQNGPFEAGLYQVFGSSITVSFGNGAAKRVYPQWGGAVSNGTTDDAAAIQQMADSLAAGMVLYFPRGSSHYDISATIDIDQVDNVTLEFAPGAELQLTASGKNGISITKNHVTVRRATMEGEGTFVTDNYVTGHKLIKSTGDHTTIEYCYLKEPENVGILVEGEYPRIHHNVIQGGPYFADAAAIGTDRQHIGIMVEATSDYCEIAHNVVKANSDANAGKVIQGVFMASGANIRDCIISNNKILAVWDHALYLNVENSVVTDNICKQGGIKVRQRAHGTADNGNTITGNVIDVNSATAPLSGDYGLHLGNAQYSVISGNTISRAQVGGIVFAGTDDPYAAIHNTVIGNNIFNIREGQCYGIGVDDSDCVAFKYNIISNNNIYDIGDSTYGKGISIHAISDGTGHEFNKFDNNNISKTRQEGIYLQRMTNGTCNGNQVYNTGINAATVGINLSDVRNYEIRHNHVTGEGAQLTYGIDEDADCRRNMITNNRFSDFSTGAYGSLQSTSYVQDNNLTPTNGNGETVTFNTSGNRTIDDADIALRMHLRDPNGAARTDTTDTAANLITYLLPYDGAYHEIIYLNTGEGAETITIAGGASVTVYNQEGAGDAVIPAGAGAKLLFVRTSSTTVSLFVTVFEAV